jgi:hypothetical protein
VPSGRLNADLQDGADEDEGRHAAVAQHRLDRRADQRGHAQLVEHRRAGGRGELRGDLRVGASGGKVCVTSSARFFRCLAMGGAPGRPAHAGTAGATRAGRGGRARRPTRRLQDGGDPLDQPVPVADVGAGCPPARRGPTPRRRRAAHLRDGPRVRQAGCLLHAGSCQPAGGSARTSTPPRTRSKEFWIDRDTTVLHHDVRAETCGDSSWPLCALGTPTKPIAAWLTGDSTRMTMDHARGRRPEAGPPHP